MEGLLQIVEGNLFYFILLFFRITALIVASPVFGRRTLPNSLKIALCLVLTYALIAARPAPGAIAFEGIVPFALLCLKELMFGLIMGFVTTLFFSVVQTAGYVIDMQMGFGMVNAFDVQNNLSVPATGNLLNVILLLCFFGVNGHLYLIRILLNTLETVPIGGVRVDWNIGLTAAEVFALSFVLVVNVAMPMIAAGLLSELVMGVVVRTVPQINMFVVGIPLKVLLGFLVLLVVLPLYVSFTNTLFDRMFYGIDRMFGGLSAA